MFVITRHTSCITLQVSETGLKYVGYQLPTINTSTCNPVTMGLFLQNDIIP